MYVYIYIYIYIYAGVCALLAIGVAMPEDIRSVFGCLVTVSFVSFSYLGFYLFLLLYVFICF